MLVIVGLTILFMVPVGAMNYLIIPMMSASHLLRLGWIGKGLIARGHTVYMIKHDSVAVPSQLEGSGIQFVQYSTDESVHFINTRNCSDMYTSLGEDPWNSVPKLLDFFDKQCNDLLENEILYEDLNKLKLDFAVVDSFTNLQCFLAYPRRLGIPYAGVGLLPPLDSFSSTLQANYITPTLPLAMKKFSETPGFWHRVRQWLIINIKSAIAEYRQNNQKLARFLRDTPITSFSELRRGSLLWLVDSHPLVSPARVTPPNVIYIGGLTTGEAKPLPDELQTFADKAVSGLIVISFGTVVKYVPETEFTAILKAVNNVTARTVLATPKRVTSSDQVLVKNWIPQNDLLAHPNVKLFITHCGSSSIHQAVYHGVPMLGLPLQEEQLANAQRLQARNYGRFLHRAEMTDARIQAEINRILTDTSIRQSVKTASRIMKDRLVEPETEAAYWLDHVTQHGSGHLTPPDELSWYQILMLDMLALFFSLLCMSLFLIHYCTYAILRHRKLKQC